MEARPLAVPVASQSLGGGSSPLWGNQGLQGHGAQTPVKPPGLFSVNMGCERCADLRGPLGAGGPLPHDPRSGRPAAHRCGLRLLESLAWDQKQERPWGPLAMASGQPGPPCLWAWDPRLGVTHASDLRPGKTCARGAYGSLASIHVPSHHVTGSPRQEGTTDIRWPLGHGC